MERQELAGLVDREVAVRLKNVEAGGVEIVATLDGVRADGIVFREVGELGPGPTVFCPWESLHGVRRRPPGLRPPHEEPAAEEPAPQGPWPGESYYMREASAEEAEPEPSERRRKPSARNLERVVPVAQKRTVGATTVALTSLELHGGGVGVLGWRISMGEEVLRDEPDFHFGIPEPMFEVLADDGRELPWSPLGGGASDGESDGEAEVWDLPETGELRVRVTRLAADAYGPDGDHVGEGASVDGPWDFRFSL